MGGLNSALASAAESARSAASGSDRNPYAVNPNVGGAGEIAAALLRIQQGAQDQQQKQQEQGAKDKAATLKDQFETELKMRKDGYTPYSPQRPLPDNSQGQPTLMQGGGSDVNPAGRPADVDPSQLVTDHFGRQWVAPPVKPEVTPQQGYTDLHTALNEGAQPVYPRIRVGEDGTQTNLGTYGPNVPDQSRVQQVPGTTQSIYTPTSDEKAATKLEQQQRADQAKPDKAEKYTYNHFTGDDGKVNVTRIGADGVPQLWNGKDWGTLAAGAQLGPKRDVMTPAQIEADKDRHEARANRAEDQQQALSDKNDAAMEKLDGQAGKLETAADQQRQLAKEYEKGLLTPKGGKFIDPMDKSRAERPMDATYWDRVMQGHVAASKKADDLGKQAATLRQQIEQRKQKFAAPAAPTPAPAAAAAPVPAQPQVQEGTVINNGKGVRLVLKGGKWVPAP
jgi:hypothetical protein